MHLDPKDSKDMLESLESPDRLVLLVLVAPLDLLASLAKTVTMEDLASPEIEDPLELRVHVVSPEPLDFPE